ncbi:MAG: site-specific DNA-methyltransferase [Promethearchaeota archaeon]|nr:MAG: site-specific DNA-methyltransferase [Candidatus Lokiarchaeota archaeon]
MPPKKKSQQNSPNPPNPQNLTNVIICGNNAEILAQIPEDYVHLTVTSPPYDKLRDYHGFNFDFRAIAAELFRITKPGGVVVWIIGDSTINGSETGSSFKQALYFKEMGFLLHDTMIYQKSGFAFPSRNRYHQIFEYMFVLSKGNPTTFNPIKDKPNKSQFTFSKKRRHKDGTMSHQQDTSRISVEDFGMRFNIWRYKTGRPHTTPDNAAYQHPALFPEKLARDHILSWSNPGDVVLDPMNGAGTTTKMAYSLGRCFIGIDISQDYCQIALERLQSVEYDLQTEENSIHPTILTAFR